MAQIVDKMVCAPQMGNAVCISEIANVVRLNKQRFLNSNKGEFGVSFCHTVFQNYTLTSHVFFSLVRALETESEKLIYYLTKYNTTIS